MDKKDLVSLQVARLLKAKGFNEVCDAGYFVGDDEIAPLFFLVPFRIKENVLWLDILLHLLCMMHKNG